MILVSRKSFLAGLSLQIWARTRYARWLWQQCAARHEKVHARLLAVLEPLLSADVTFDFAPVTLQTEPGCWEVMFRVVEVYVVKGLYSVV